MSFQNKYQIQSVLSDGEFRVFRALEVSSGRNVLIHHMAFAQGPLLQSDFAVLIFRFLRSDPSPESQYFLDMGEEDNRAYVVTADVPECLDIRQWLEWVIYAQAGKEGTAQPAGGTPGPGNPNSTRAFTIESFREVLGLTEASSIQPLRSRSWQGRVLQYRLRRFPRCHPKLAITARPPFPARGRKHLWRVLPGHPAYTPMPPPPPKSLEGPFQNHEITAEVIPVPVSMVDLDTAMLTPPSSQAKGSAGQLADFVMTPPNLMKPSVAPRAVETPKPAPQPAPIPAAYVAGTKTPREFTGLQDQAPRQAPAPPSPSGSVVKPEASGKTTVKLPRVETSGGFEAVFQNSKPPLGPTSMGLPAVPPADYRTAPIPVVLPPTPSPAGSVNIPSPQPSLYVTYDTPLYSTGKKRKNWVPILILSSSFLMTVALLLFYAFKN